MSTIENRETIINRIYYIAYKYRIRDMEFVWDGRPFDPVTKADQQILETAPLDTLQEVLNAYLTKKDAIYGTPDDQVYWKKQKRVC